MWSCLAVIQISLIKSEYHNQYNSNCIVYSILQKYPELLKLFNLSQNNILSASSQRFIVNFSGNQKSKVVFSIDQGCRSEYSDYGCATLLWSVLNFEF